MTFLSVHNLCMDMFRERLVFRAGRWGSVIPLAVCWGGFLEALPGQILIPLCTQISCFQTLNALNRKGEKIKRELV